MPRNSLRDSRAWLAAALAGLALAGTVADAGAQRPRWNGAQYQAPSGRSCRGMSDPIGVVFHGTSARFGQLGSWIGGRYHSGIVEDHTTPAGQPGAGWGAESSTAFDYANYGICNVRQDAEVASPGRRRHHLRMWQQAEQHVPGKWQTVGTPHWDHTSDDCPRHFVPERMRIPSHWGGGTGSGYDYSRRALLRAFRHSERHESHSVYWGNSNEIGQCRGRYGSSSNGYVNIIRIGR